mgnify:CR=1 FL=1
MARMGSPIRSTSHGLSDKPFTHHLLSDLKGIGTKGKVGREDLGRPAHIGCPNCKLQGQVAAVGGVGKWDLQGSKDILGQFDIECRAGTQSSQIQRCGSQFVNPSRNRE